MIKRSFIVLVFIAFASAQIHAEQKDELQGLKFTGLPLVSVNSDDGFGYGLRVFATYYEEGTDPFLWQAYGQYYKTTRGYEFHELNLDAVRFLGLPLRVRMRGGLERTLNAQYYGFGNFQDIQRQKKIKRGEIAINENVVRDPVTGDVVNDVWTFDEYGNSVVSINERALQGRTDPGIFNPGKRLLGYTQDKYFYYDRIRPFAELTTEQFFGDTNFKWFFGLRGQMYEIQSYQGDFEGGDKLPNNPTLIDLEKPVGYDATEKERFVNGIRGGLMYDSRPRKRELNPNAGIFADLHVEGVGKGTGSHYSYMRYTFAWRQYIEVLPSLFNPRDEEMVFAYRLLGQRTTGDVPFFEAGRIYTTRESAEGLGGSGGLRGYPANQFVDKVMAMANFEMRYTFSKVALLGGIDWVLLVYHDVGRVAPTNHDMTLKGLHNATGLGIRMVWQRNTIVNISAGRSQFESNFNFGFNHMF